MAKRSKNFLSVGDDVTSIQQLWELARANGAVDRFPFSPDTFAVGDPFHDRYVRDLDELDRYYVQTWQPLYEETMDNYDLFLAQVPDTRSKDELWRANIFVPLPGTNVEAKVTNEANIATRADPMFQCEGVADADKEVAKEWELLLDANYRANRFRKLFLESRRAVAIQGIDFLKTVWTTRSHNVMVWTSKTEKEDFLKRIQEAVANGAPIPPDFGQDSEGFEKWRTECNLVKKTTMPIPEFPRDGLRRIVRFEGPEIIRLPLHAVHVDPTVAEMRDQDVSFHRVLLPLQWVLERTGEEPDKPFRPEQVVRAMAGWDGNDLERYDREVTKKLGINPMERQYADPFFKSAVEILEVIDERPSSPVKLGILLNRKAIINKDFGEFPTWGGGSLITPHRNVQLPGQFMGISDYKWPKSLYHELRHLRNMRSDFVTQTVIPVWTKLKESGVPDLIRMVSPGAVLTVNRHDAFRAAERPSMPAEAYREPQEIKAEIADSHGIWDSTKGAPATVGRVTSVEFTGRAQQTQVRLLMGLAVFEDEHLDTIRQQLSMFAQNWRDDYKNNFGGRFKGISRDQLIQSLSYHFRFRGVSMALDRNLQVQQLLQVAQQFAPGLPPAANFKLIRLILDTLDIRGLSEIITQEDEQTAVDQASGAADAQAGQNAQAQDESAAAGVDVSKAGTPASAGGGGPQPPPPGPSQQG